METEPGTKSEALKKRIALTVFVVLIVLVVGIGYMFSARSGSDDTQSQSRASISSNDDVSGSGSGSGSSGSVSASPSPTYSYRTPDTSDVEDRDDMSSYEDMTKESVYTSDDSWVEAGSDVSGVDASTLEAIVNMSGACVAEWAQASSWETVESRASRLSCFVDPDKYAAYSPIDGTPIKTSQTSDGRVWQDAQQDSTEVYSYDKDLNGQETALVEVMLDRAQYTPDPQTPTSANRRSSTTQVLVRAVNDGGTWKIAGMWIPTV